MYNRPVFDEHQIGAPCHYEPPEEPMPKQRKRDVTAWSIFAGAMVTALTLGWSALLLICTYKALRYAWNA